MSYTISITKKRKSSFSPTKIKPEEFATAVQDDDSLIWLEEYNLIENTIKEEYRPRSVAIWPLGDSDNENIWFVLNDSGTIDFGYRPQYDFSSNKIMNKIIEMAGRLNCYLEGEDGKVYFDPTQ